MSDDGWNTAKTTKAQFKLFRAEAEKWIDFFGLADWDVTFLHNEIDDGRAETSADELNSLANITLAKEFQVQPGGEISESEIKQCAFHEACELLLFRLRILSTRRSTRVEEVMREMHRVINILENTIFKNAC